MIQCMWVLLSRVMVPLCQHGVHTQRFSGGSGSHPCCASRFNAFSTLLACFQLMLKVQQCRLEAAQAVHVVVEVIVGGVVWRPW